MGASVAITAFADPAAPKADALILSGPGLWGWSALPWYYSASLWVSSHVRPDWIVVPPEGVNIVATDNNRKLREMWYDPLVQKKNRIDSVYGVVSIMDEADQKLAKLPDDIPTLLLRGARDEVIPEEGVRHATLKMSPHIRTAFYARGYHMLMNDLQAETVWRDILAFARQPESPLPSRSPPLPWLARHAVDKKGKGFRPGEEGYPSPGRVAWALWGGDPAVAWSARVVSYYEDKDMKKRTYNAAQRQEMAASGAAMPDGSWRFEDVFDNEEVKGLLPMSVEDIGFLDHHLGTGRLLMLSRGYGNCRISNTRLPNCWRVVYYNAMDKVILNTVEVVDMPEVAMAAPEDLRDSHTRLGDVLAYLEAA